MDYGEAANGDNAANNELSQILPGDIIQMDGQSFVVPGGNTILTIELSSSSQITITHYGTILLWISALQSGCSVTDCD